VDYTQSYFESLFTQAIYFLPKLVSAIVIFLVALYLAKLAAKATRKALEYRKTDPELILLLSRVAHWSIAIMGIIAALQQVNFNVSSFIAGLGIVGFTLSFAFQDIAKNFISGVLLLIQQPFDIGDGIDVAGVGGTVENIELRSTSLRTWDGKLVIIPNADVYAGSITNYSKSPKRRVQINVGVAYDSDLEQVATIAKDAVSVIDGVQETPAPTVYFNAFADSSINCTISIWIDTAKIGLFSAEDLTVKAIKFAFETEKIEIPYPVQTVLLEK